jgi:hypothetical protein
LIYSVVVTAPLTLRDQDLVEQEPVAFEEVGQPVEQVVADCWLLSRQQASLRSE